MSESQDSGHKPPVSSSPLHHHLFIRNQLCRVEAFLQSVLVFPDSFINLFVCLSVCFTCFFFYPSPSETRRLFLLEQRPGRCDGRAESQHKEQKSTGKHLFYMCDCCPVSHLNEKKKQKLSISAGSGCLLKKTLLINSSFYFFLQSNSVFTFCAWCFRESD